MEGLWFHRWASEPNKGQSKLGKAVQSLLARGLVESVDPKCGFPSAQFTTAGLEALRAWRPILVSKTSVIETTKQVNFKY